MNVAKLVDAFQPVADVVTRVGTGLKTGLEVGSAAAVGLGFISGFIPGTLPVAAIAGVTGTCAAISTMLKKTDSVSATTPAPVTVSNSSQAPPVLTVPSPVMA